MDAVLDNGFWISTDTYLTQKHRDKNARAVYDNLKLLGWTKQAIAGILGNMDVESSLNPALIEGRTYHYLIDNDECLGVIDKGVGLVQWTGTTDTDPAGQKLASFAIRNGMDWYDGNLQCYRLQFEYEHDLQFDPGQVDGVQWNWATYVSSSNSPGQLAKVWQYLYERGGIDTELRQRKATYYYNLLEGVPIWMLALFTRKRKEMKRPCRRM